MIRARLPGSRAAASASLGSDLINKRSHERHAQQGQVCVCVLMKAPVEVSALFALLHKLTIINKTELCIWLLL